MDPRLDPDYLKPVSLLPAAFRCVFPFRYFNAVQSESFADVFLSDDNLVISAPTGSGKTVLFELCIVRLLERFLSVEGHFNHAAGARKTVYIAPMKALVQDKFREWDQKFSSLGVKCQELTSDSGPTNVQDMLNTDIILTTPEKFDVITRRHRDRGGMSLFGDIALLLIDEVHLLSETRGAALEAVVSRLKMLARFPEIKGCPLSAIRFVAVSATVPNIEDLGDCQLRFLCVPDRHLRLVLEVVALKQLHKLLALLCIFVGNELWSCPLLASSSEYRKLIRATLHDLMVEPVTACCLICSTVCACYDMSAEWLRVPKNGIKRFGEEYRPVKLATIVLGYQAAKNDFLFERRLQNYLLDILMHHSGGRPSLVFCSTRKGAQETAVSLVQSVSNHGHQNPFVKNLEHFDRLQVAALRTTDVHMQQCIRNGVGYHNGGLSMQDRSLVEELFLKGDLLVLCTTSTLAQGVNLPAYAVVIKSTQYYNKTKSSYVEYERSAILQVIYGSSPYMLYTYHLAEHYSTCSEEEGYVHSQTLTLKFTIQMSGRAGRPQFEDSGIVIIMTRNDSVHLYQNLLSGLEPVESQLLPSIAEHLNAEIVLMTVTDCSQAIDWLKCSYLYVRIKKNPQHYNIKKGVSPDQLENKLKDICVQNVNELAKFGLVKTDEFGFVLTPLEPGRIMEKYYLRFETMKAITKAPLRSTMEDFLHILTNAEELSWIKLRRNEKKRLNDINGDMSGRIRFHVNASNGKLKKRIQSDAEKIFILVNDALSGEPSALDFTMTQDINGICSTGTRICRCMSDYFIFLKRYTEIRNALLLSKCLKQRLWENTKFQIKQLAGVGLVTAKALVTGGIDSFEKLANADPRRLEAITGRKFPYGDQLKTSLNDVAPKIEMNLFDNGRDDQCLLTLHRVSQPKASGKKFHSAELVVGNKTDNTVLFRERIRMDQFSSPYAVTITCNSASNEQQILVVAALISEEYVGVDVVCKLTVNRETKGGGLGLSEGQGCQEQQTPAKHFYGSCLIETTRRTGASDTPVLEAPSRYPPKSFDPSPVTLATRNFLNKFMSGIKESPLKNIPPNPTGQEPDETSEIEVLATSPIHPSKFSPSKRSDHADSPEILTSSYSSDVVDTSLCSSLIEPSEILEIPGCNSLITAPQRELLPPRFPSRRLFHTLRSSNEVTQVKTSSSLMNDQIREAPPVISLNSDVSQVISSCTQERRSTNNAGFPENSADRSTISSSRNVCAGENLTETLTPQPPFDERHGTTHDYAEFNMADQVYGPSVSTPAPSSSTSQAATPDLLSSDLRRKIRRTGFSSILKFSSVADNAQRNITGTMNMITQSSEKRPLHTDGNGGQQNIVLGPKVLVPSTTLPVSVTSTNVPNLPLNKGSDQPDLRRTITVCPGRRSEEVSIEEPDLVVLESVANPCQPKQLWTSIKNKFSAKTKRSFSSQGICERAKSVLHQGPDNVKTSRLIRERSSIDDRFETSSSAQIESPSNQAPLYREVKSFNFEFATKPTSNVSSILNSAVEDPEEYISLDHEPSNNNNRSFTSKAKRLKVDDSGTKAIESNQASFKEDFSSYRFDHTPPVVRPTIALLGGSETTQPSPAGKQEFMGYKSLFSFL